MIGSQVSHYRIQSTLGAGGMGVVYAAEDVRLERPVALKFLPEGCTPEAVERFRREARTASALNHPNICTVYDVGEHDSRPFIVMELLRGSTLASRIAARPLRVDEIVDIAIQSADALEAAHGARIVHRDIKPANLFITDAGHVKVLDFGVSKLSEQGAGGGTQTIGVTTPDLTGHGATLGTVAYMSPEHLLGEPLDGRADLFSLGVVMYEMTMGVPPFKAATSAAVISAILHADPPSIHTLRADVPQEWQRIIAKALEKDRSVRYQSAADLRADLVRMKRSSGTAPVARAATGTVEKVQALRLVQSWEAVARDGRDFAERGSGIMYWFRVPLGGICYPDGFRSFLQPALENARISKIRFVLDTSDLIRQTWDEMVLPLIDEWGGRSSQELRVERHEDGGSVLLSDGRTVGWVFVDLSQEFSPCFKLFVDDPDSSERAVPGAQIFLATAVRTVRLKGGAQRTIRIPDTILRVQAPGDENLLLALNRVANQWDLMFS